MTEHPVVSRPEPTLDAERAVRDRGADPLREALDVDRLAEALHRWWVDPNDPPDDTEPVWERAVPIIAAEYAALGEEPHGQ